MMGHAQEVYGRMAGEQLDPLLLSQGPDEPLLDGFPRRILDMQNPAPGMAALLGIVQALGGAVGKGNAELFDEDGVHQLFGLAGQQLDGLRVVDAVAGLDDVFGQELGIVARAE